MNSVKTIGLMIGLTALLVLIGGYLGGRHGMIVALAFATIMNLFSYWFSDKIVLAMYRAQEVDEATAPTLFRVVRGLAEKAGMPMPRVYIIPQAQPNAFATGRDPKHAAVAATQGLLQLMDEQELEGVIAHELSHVRNRDILIGTIAATLAGAVMILARMAQFAAIFGGGGRDRDEERGGGLGLIFVAIFGAIAAALIQLAISRVAGIPGRRLGGQAFRRSARAGAGAIGPGAGHSARTHGGQSRHFSHVHREPLRRRGIGAPVQHSPAHRRSHRPSGADGGRYLSPACVVVPAGS